VTTQEGDKAMRCYWTTACGDCPPKKKCTTAPARRIPRWEHEHVLEAVQARLDADPQAMRRRRETVEHPFGTLKARMGATHFLMRTLPKVAAEMALQVLAYNLTRVMNIVGVKPLLARSGREGSGLRPEPGPITSGHDPGGLFYTTKTRIGHQTFSASARRHAERTSGRPFL
jgi:hypothetical protein